VQDWPAAGLTPRDAAAVLAGRPVPLGAETRGNVRLYDGAGTLIALARAEEGAAKPFRVFEGGQ
jgi:hypothetical protein